MNLDHVIIVKAETEEEEATVDVLHDAGCVDAVSIRAGVGYSCAIGNEVEQNGVDAFHLDLQRDGIYLVGLEVFHHRSMNSAWAEIDIEVEVKELTPSAPSP